MLEKRLPICGAALGVGTLYGGVAAVLFVSLLSLISTAMGGEAGPPLLGVAPAAMIAGAVGGCVAGVAGNFTRRLRACVLAGMAGGLAPVATFILIALIEEGGWPREALPLGLQVLAMAPVVIGGLLGLAVGRGLQTGRSAVPGVQTLVEKMQRLDAPEPPRPHPVLPAEVTPAAMPAGRGDEAAPAG